MDRVPKGVQQRQSPLQVTHQPCHNKVKKVQKRLTITLYQFLQNKEESRNKSGKLSLCQIYISIFSYFPLLSTLCNVSDSFIKHLLLSKYFLSLSNFIYTVKLESGYVISMLEFAEEKKANAHRGIFK